MPPAPHPPRAVHPGRAALPPAHPPHRTTPHRTPPTHPPRVVHPRLGLHHQVVRARQLRGHARVVGAVGHGGSHRGCAGEAEEGGRGNRDQRRLRCERVALASAPCRHTSASAAPASAPAAAKLSGAPATSRSAVTGGMSDPASRSASGTRRASARAASINMSSRTRVERDIITPSARPAVGSGSRRAEGSERCSALREKAARQVHPPFPASQPATTQGPVAAAAPSAAPG